MEHEVTEIVEAEATFRFNIEYLLDFCSAKVNVRPTSQYLSMKAPPAELEKTIWRHDQPEEAIYPIGLTHRVPAPPHQFRRLFILAGFTDDNGTETNLLFDLYYVNAGDTILTSYGWDGARISYAYHLAEQVGVRDVSMRNLVKEVAQRDMRIARRIAQFMPPRRPPSTKTVRGRTIRIQPGALMDTIYVNGDSLMRYSWEWPHPAVTDSIGRR